MGLTLQPPNPHPMLLSAYLTTGLAIKIFSRLSMADISVHGQEHLPPGPIIFVVNHFTRVETLLLPYSIYRLTHKPVLSLAAASLFKGGLEKFLTMVGVVSTDDPRRDELIIRNLLTGAADWIIFPEGSMIKTKKIVHGGRYMVADPDGMREPHTGAAALALRAELLRRRLLQAAREPSGPAAALAPLGIDSLDEVPTTGVSIVPVNLTYYPIRTAENIALQIASRLVKDMSERMVEEIMTEGTMLLSGVDLDIRFGAPLAMGDFLSQNGLEDAAAAEAPLGYAISPGLKDKMRPVAYEIMQRYMHDIYALTTINHEHLLAAFLRMYPFREIPESDLKRRIFYAASLVTGKKGGKDIFFVHRSLRENQAHLLIDDRYGKFANFFALAGEKGVLRRRGEMLVCDRAKLSGPLSFHRGRIDNPIEVMANEVEPLQQLSALLRRLARLPSFVVRLAIIRYLLREDRAAHQRACQLFPVVAEGRQVADGRSFLLPSWRRSLGVVLVHSYLASPAEVRGLARYLRRRGIWVFAPRLPGHGTCVEDLALRKHREWVETVESAYVLLRTVCRRVVVGGVAFGGSLALDLAARARVRGLAGVFAVSPPFALKDYSARIIPPSDVWNRFLAKLKREEKPNDYLQFTGDDERGNYSRNPVSGVHEVGDFLEEISDRYGEIAVPALIMQSEANPVVDPKGSQRIFAMLGSADKEFAMLSGARHILVAGEGEERSWRRIASFLDSL